MGATTTNAGLTSWQPADGAAASPPVAATRVQAWHLGARFGIPYEPYREQVDRLYGGGEWRQILRALDQRKITASEYRKQMVNLMRWKLEHELGYAITHRIPMQMQNKLQIYDMVFATDHVAGDRIMRHLDNQAALREPDMMRQAKEAKSGQVSLFEGSDLGANDSTAGQELWRPEPCWDPTSAEWWSYDDYLDENR